eukprot:TRINITY_DN246_c0_g1_i2.p1 TRINITY_DN246_c0_g1~~TRINITY_DN246_c0_g1_i2.p1  ORF type:complete len:204 (-),score=38.12 TRINITY_DN246_c0_g1_i2:187-798(-)
MRSSAAVVALVAFALMASASAQFCSTPLASVSEIDLNRYSGKWYEIATTALVRNEFEQNCYCSNVNYTVTSDSNGPYVAVRNECRKGSVGGPADFVLGRADQLNPAKPGELAVSFDGTPATIPNYYIMTLGPDRDYGYALVGEPCRLALWMLSRTPSISPETYNDLVAFAERNGFNTRTIGFAPTVQEGCWSREGCGFKDIRL